MWAPYRVVSFPDPTLKEGKGLVYIEWFLGLEDMAFLNSRTSIWFMPCGLHVIFMWHRAIAIYCMRVGAVDVLPCQNNALSCQSHDMLHPAWPRNRSMYTQTLSLPWGWGLGTRLHIGYPSLIPRPHPLRGKRGLVNLDRFLGLAGQCARAATVVLKQTLDLIGQ